MNSHETRVDVWSRVLLAIALLLLLIHQTQLMSPLSGYPRVFIPSAYSVLPAAPRYPQPLPARDNFDRQWSAKPQESQAASPRRGGWVF
ncbi:MULTISPECIES: hypothetical protein [Pseudomonas]|uniref:hypothetical protein n=1 Tax=Pseudomonas TaxID=286 RepID=UPI0023D80EE6|nr:hypothetical protein [Pseudomonas sp. PSE14]WEJ72283.1 hypothetical protein O6P39_27200 [Pseudomonas sp. PSE14]